MLYLKFVDAIDVNLKDPSSPLQPELRVKLKHQVEQRCAGLDGALLWTLKLAVKPPKPLSIMWEQLALEQAQKLVRCLAELGASPFLAAPAELEPLYLVFEKLLCCLWFLRNCYVAVVFL